MPPVPLSPGAPAPEFSLASSGGGQVSLQQLRGKSVVLYFYPKDDTPGCTTEACEFRDAAAPFTRSGAVVLGVSPDSAASHDKFVAKFQLSFPLLADPDHAVAEAYGVWVEKSMYGRKYMGVERSTFLIGPDGAIRNVWRSVKPAGHAQEVLQLLTGAGGSAAEAAPGRAPRKPSRRAKSSAITRTPAKRSGNSKPVAAATRTSNRARMANSSAKAASSKALKSGKAAGRPATKSGKSATAGKSAKAAPKQRK